MNDLNHLHYKILMITNVILITLVKKIINFGYLNQQHNENFMNFIIARLVTFIVSKVGQKEQVS